MLSGVVSSRSRGGTMAQRQYERRQNLVNGELDSGSLLAGLVWIQIVKELRLAPHSAHVHNGNRHVPLLGSPGQPPGRVGGERGAEDEELASTVDCIFSGPLHRLDNVFAKHDDGRLEDAGGARWQPGSLVVDTDGTGAAVDAQGWVGEASGARRGASSRSTSPSGLKRMPRALRSARFSVARAPEARALRNRSAHRGFRRAKCS
ncbi:hypothetical protein CP533_4971 [Ophiocordyceps camponoti-saundersi (nom. inval.)]|nr:hypothetical protein CP533_4971 [Ophiocordyceps camponoti-saundersi (nom. inval.)]